MPENLELLRGTLDLIVRKTLTWGPMHGLAIVRWIESVTKSQLQIEEGCVLSRSPSHGAEGLAQRRVGRH